MYKRKVCTPATTASLFTSVSQYKIVSVYVTSQPVYSVFAMLREHFPGDLAVYISHSNSFVLNICHFLSLISHPPLLSGFLYLVPLRDTSTKSGLIFVHFNHMLAIAERRQFPPETQQHWPFVQTLKTNYVFLMSFS